MIACVPEYRARLLFSCEHQAVPVPSQLLDRRSGTAQLIALYRSGTYKQFPPIHQLVSFTAVRDTTVLIVTSNTVLDSNEGKALIDHLRTDSTSPAQGLHNNTRNQYGYDSRDTCRCNDHTLASCTRDDAFVRPLELVTPRSTTPHSGKQARGFTPQSGSYFGMVQARRPRDRSTVRIDVAAPR